MNRKERRERTETPGYFAFLCADLCVLCVEIRRSERRTIYFNAKAAEVFAKVRRVTGLHSVHSIAD